MNNHERIEAVGTLYSTKITPRWIGGPVFVCESRIGNATVYYQFLLSTCHEIKCGLAYAAIRQCDGALRLEPMEADHV